MKVLLVTEYFYPHSVGGTEQYVHELAQGLNAADVDISILTISGSKGIYKYDSFTVYTIPANANHSKNTIAGVTPPDNLDIFTDTINGLRPDIIHFHTLTTSIGIYHYKAANKAGIKVIFTSHIPGNTCLRGDLMKFGKNNCDGKIRLNTCQACYLHSKGLPKVISPTAASLMRILKYPGILSQASAMKKQQLEQIKTICTAVVTMSNWQQKVFLVNGFNTNTLMLSRYTFKEITNTAQASTNGQVINIGFAGRISPEKGLHILIEAFKRLSAQRFTLKIAAIRSASHEEYLSRLLSETKELTNIHWNFEYTPDTINNFYQEINVLCIPSVLNETGPYVMFEAIARHIPAIASNLGGMREWADLNYPVTVYPHHDVNELFRLLNNFPASIASSINYPPNRKGLDLAHEMINVYKNGD